MTGIQILTLVLFIGYLIWEVVVWLWKRSLSENDPVIRADLIFIYPVLGIFLILSIYQYLKHPKHSS